MTAETTDLRPEALDQVVIRFAGDSGDGMQLAGDRFTDVSAAFGNDLATMPNFPAEIRAPAGTIAGVSSFQVHISDHEILTPGDMPNVLVAMNPAALKANIAELAPGGSLLVNSDAFDTRALEKAGYAANPLEDGSLAAYRVVQVPMTTITLESTKELGVKPRDAERSKNFFALGLLSWMYTRPIEATLEWIEQKYANRELVKSANLAAFKAGYNFGETAELFDHAYEVAPARLAPGRYRNITGNIATSYGLIAAAQQANLPLLYASYPITPASDILHELSRHKNFGVRTLQAEDEIAAVGVAIGAAFVGPARGDRDERPGRGSQVRGPRPRDQPRAAAAARRRAAGRSLDRSADEDRAGRPHAGHVRPSRRGAAPDRRRPFAEPLLRRHDRGGADRAEVPDTGDPAHRRLHRERRRAVAAPRRRRACPTCRCSSRPNPNHDGVFWPYLRDPETLARPWAIPGTPGLMHRIGGIEKQDGTGNVNYDPENHEHMVHLRAEKVARIASDIPGVEVDDPDGAGNNGSGTPADLLVLGWGSTWGVAQQAVRQARSRRQARRARAPDAPQPVPGQPG